MSTAPFHYVHALDGVPEDSPERVEMHRHEYVDPGTVYLSIYDDADECVTFEYDQIDALLDALVACKQYMKGLDVGERRNAADAAREDY